MKKSQICPIWPQSDRQSGIPATSQLTDDIMFGSKVGQIGPKWDKSGTFSDQISVHLARSSQMY